MIRITKQSEILFRGKTIKNKWVEGFLMMDNNDNPLIISDSPSGMMKSFIEVDAETIEMWTGEVDLKRGNKVFKPLLNEQSMKTFKAGDSVICIEVVGIDLTLGDKYKVLDSNLNDNKNICIIDDSGEEGRYKSRRFTLAK